MLQTGPLLFFPNGLLFDTCRQLPKTPVDRFACTETCGTALPDVGVGWGLAWCGSHGTCPGIRGAPKSRAWWFREENDDASIHGNGETADVIVPRAYWVSIRGSTLTKFIVKTNVIQSEVSHHYDLWSWKMPKTMSGPWSLNLDLNQRTVLTCAHCDMSFSCHSQFVPIGQ